MARKNERYSVGAGTRQAIARLMLVLEANLDEEWTLDHMAARVGYARHHFARAFAEIVRASPLEYLRSLRLHRAAHRIANDAQADLVAVAEHAGYASLKAFRRAFERELGRPPSAFRREHAVTRAEELRAVRGEIPPPPEGLSAKAKIQILGPLAGVSLRAPSMTDSDLLATLAQFLGLVRPQSAWTTGTMSPPWGWTGGGIGRRELRCVSIVELSQPPTPPLEPWSMGAHRYARLDYSGSTRGIRAAYPWIMDVWMRASRWRYAFAPVLTLYDLDVWTASRFAHSDARIFVPVERNV